MNLLHISDMHFGSRHWEGDNGLLLEKLNSYAADVIFNTGDITTDSLEGEFEAAGKFLNALNCRQIISIVGNHDKRSMRSQDFFREHIADIDVIRPLDPEKCRKNKIFVDQYTTGIAEKFSDINFIKKITIGSESLLVVGLDTSELFQDIGFIDAEMLKSVSKKIEQFDYDKIVLLNHHSILDTDSDPLFNSGRIIDFVRKHKIHHVFCGHTHKLELVQSTDLYYDHVFTQYKNGSLTSCNTPRDSNMFLFYEDFATAEMKIHVVRIFIEGGELIFREEVIATK